MPDEFPLALYGYAIIYRKNRESPWIVDQDDEYRNLPAHYLSGDEAHDRARFLREKGIEVRIAALMADPDDTPEMFKENKIEQ